MKYKNQARNGTRQAPAACKLIAPSSWARKFLALNLDSLTSDTKEFVPSVGFGRHGDEAGEQMPSNLAPQPPPSDDKGPRKSIAFIALSSFAHLSLLAAIATMPRPQFGTRGSPDGNASGGAIMMDIQDAGAASSAQPGNGGEDPAAAQVTALEAQAVTDPSAAKATDVAVALPAAPPQEPPVAAAAAPVPPPVQEAQPEVVVKAETPKAAEPVAEAKPEVKPVAPKPEPKPAKLAAKTPKAPKKAKFASSLPKKAGAVAKSTADSSVEAALANAREEETLPEASTWKATEREQESARENLAKEQASAKQDDEPSSNLAQEKPAAPPVVEAPSEPVETAPPVQKRTAFAPIPIATAAATTASAPSTSDVPLSEAAANARNGAAATQAKANAAVANTNGLGADGSGTSTAGTGAGRGATGGAGIGIPAGTEVRSAEELAEQPGNRMPTYPMQDRAKSREGVVVLIGKVAPDGHVAQATLQKSSGSTFMDRASMDAFKKWRFAAGQEGYVYKTFRFSLKGEAQEMPARLAQ